MLYAGLIVFSPAFSTNGLEGSVCSFIHSLLGTAHADSYLTHIG